MVYTLSESCQSEDLVRAPAGARNVEVRLGSATRRGGGDRLECGGFWDGVAACFDPPGSGDRVADDPPGYGILHLGRLVRQPGDLGSETLGFAPPSCDGFALS
jgi:hypothetical protein